MRRLSTKAWIIVRKTDGSVQKNEKIVIQQRSIIKSQNGTSNTLPTLSGDNLFFCICVVCVWGGGGFHLSPWNIRFPSFPKVIRQKFELLREGKRILEILYKNTFLRFYYPKWLFLLWKEKAKVNPRGKNKDLCQFHENSHGGINASPVFLFLHPFSRMFVSEFYFVPQSQHFLIFF